LQTKDEQTALLPSQTKILEVKDAPQFWAVIVPTPVTL
jgi:hypothetical protein